MAGLGESETVFFAEFLEIESGQRDDASVFAKELAADLDGACSLGAGSQKDGEKLLIREGTGTQCGHFLPWFLVGRKVLDTLMFGHRNEASIFPGKVASSGRGRENDCLF